METNKRLRFRPPVVIEITSWKEDTRRMKFSRPNALKAAWSGEDPCTLAENDHHDNCLGHHGDPEEEEVIVLEEPERPDEVGPRVVRVPRAPTQKEIETHESTHISHAEWCEVCMAGRARNKPHRKNNKRTEFCTGEVDEEEPEATGTPGRPVAEGASPVGPVARVCMDYLYVSSRPGRGQRAPRVGAQEMSTKELQKKLRDMGKSDKGQRSVLIERYERYAREEEQEETLAGQ